MDHGDGFLPDRFCSLLQVEFFGDGNDKDIIALACANRNQGLEDRRGIHPGKLRDGDAVDGFFPVRIAVRGIGHLVLFQQAHDIGFHFGHTYSPVPMGISIRFMLSQFPHFHKNSGERNLIS